MIPTPALPREGVRGKGQGARDDLKVKVKSEKYACGLPK
jgi:hypothetical protein